MSHVEKILDFAWFSRRLALKTLFNSVAGDTILAFLAEVNLINRF